MSDRAAIFAQLSTGEQALAIALGNGASEAEALELAGRKRMPTGGRLQLLTAWLEAPAVVEVIPAEYVISENAIAQELAALAFMNPQNYFDEQGAIRPLHELPPHHAKAIKKITVKRLRSSKSTEVVESTIEFYDKKASLELLGKWKEIGMFVDKIGTNVDDPLMSLLNAIGRKNVESSPLPSGA